MFKELDKVMAAGTDLSLAIRKDGCKMTVSILPKSSGVKDSAKDQIVPLVVSGSPEELDEGFLSIVTKPVEAVCGLLSRMEEFERAGQQAAAASRMAKEQKDKAASEEKARREKYDALLAKADASIAAGRHSEALPLLEQAMEVAPEKDRQKMEKRINAAKVAMGMGSLFGTDEAADIQERSDGSFRSGTDSGDYPDDLPEEFDSRFQMQSY